MKTNTRYKLNHYFNFTKQYRRGTLTLLALIFVLSFIPFLYPVLFPPKSVNSTAFAQQINQLKANDSGHTNKNNYAHTYDNRQASFDNHNQYSNSHTTYNGTLFYFDPNTLDEAGWQKLGLSAKAAASIRKYIDKGGKFRQPDDIKKIYTLKPADAERLLPYVKIAVSEKKQDRPQFEEFTETPKAKQYNKPLTDINTADTAAFIALPGIGSKLAGRLVLFREKLGGFYSINQVAETFGLPDSTYQLIKPLLTINNNHPIKQININTASVDHLKAHPYIKYPLANAIVQYRIQHGQFTQLEQLKNIALITPELYNKIAAYLSL